MKRKYVETLFDFFVLRKVRMYTRKLVKVDTFFLRVWLPGTDLSESEAYQFDLVDTTRQALANTGT